MEIHLLILILNICNLLENRSIYELKTGFDRCGTRFVIRIDVKVIDSKR